MVHQKVEKPSNFQSLGSLRFCFLAWRIPYFLLRTVEISQREGSLQDFFHLEVQCWEIPLKLCWNLNYFVRFQFWELSLTSSSSQNGALASHTSRTEQHFLSWLPPLALLSKPVVASGPNSPSPLRVRSQKLFHWHQWRCSSIKKKRIGCVK